MRSDRSSAIHGATEAGFTLVETLLAGLILLAIAVSTIPLFTRALANNAAGMDSTEVSNLAVERVEHLIELPFASAELTLPPGESARVDEEYYWKLTDAWLPYPLPTSLVNVLYTRRTTIRQYPLGAFSDGRLETDEALVAEAAAAAVHMKEIEVRVEQQGSAAGPAKSITLRTLKVR